MTMIHIADKQTDELLGFIHADDFWASVRERQLKDNVDTFDFETFATEPFSAKLEDRNRILIEDKTGGYAEFIIDESIQLMDSSGFHFKSVYTNASFLELRKQKLISPQTTNSMSPEDHVAFALAGTEWQVGNVDYGENHITVLTEYMNAYDYLRNIARWSGMELRFRVEHDGTRVTGRYVDLVEYAGEWRGFEAVFGDNLTEIERRRKYDNIVTALLGVGPDNDDGSPREEVLVEDDTALQMWGRGGAHYIEVFEPQSEDQNINPEKLEELTREELTKRISHQTEYVATVESLAEVIGTDPNILQFGDIVRVKDEMFNPPLYLEARVHSIKEDIKEYGDSEIVLGDFIEFSEDDVKDALRRMQDAIDKKVGNAEVVEAIENVAELKKVVQPTPPADTRVLWIDNSNKPYIAKVYVDAVEGWVKMSHTTAEEVGADPEGSADAALATARAEISDVVDTLEAFQNDYDNFVSDGFISRAEALSIERHLAALSAEKRNVDSEYTATYGNPKLEGTPKTALASAKTAYNTEHADLIAAINTAIADGYVTPAEKTAVADAFTAYETALGNYATARANASSAISFKQSDDARIAAIQAAATDAQTKATAARDAAIDVANTKAEAEREVAKAYADGIVDEEEKARIEQAAANLLAAQQDASTKAQDALDAAKTHADAVRNDLGIEIGELVDELDGFETTVNGAFKDGIIQEAEAKAIEKYKNSVGSEKGDLDNRYTQIYANPALVGTAKTNLASAKTAYNTAYTNLISSIDTAIADGKTTATEKADVDTKFASYRTALNTLVTRLEAAIKSTVDKKAADAQAAAIQAAATDATNKANAAQTAAESFATTKAEAERVIAQSYADGIVSDEEDARITAVNDALIAAAATAQDKADAAALAASEYADTALENLDISDRNFMRNSEATKGTTTREHMYYGRIDDALSDIGAGEKITISFDIRSTTEALDDSYVTVYNSNRRGQWTFTDPASVTFTKFGNEWTRVSFQSEVKFDEERAAGDTYIEFYSTYDTGRFFEVRKLKIQRGDKATAWTPAPEDLVAEAKRLAGVAEKAAKDYADGLKRAIDEDLSTLSTALTDFETEVNGSFADGIIEAAEAKAIEKYKNGLLADKADVDKRFDRIYANPDLTGTPKTNLNTAKTNFNAAHSNLITSINAAITDGKTTAAEKADVDAKFVLYNNAIATLSTRFEEAITAITNKAAGDAASGAVNAAAEDAKEKAALAQSAAELYAAAEAEQARLTAEAFADGIVSDEEAARLKEAADKLEEAKAYAEEKAKEAVDAIDNSDLATKEELDAARERLEEQISSRLGVNALRNSIGYAQLDFWQFTTASMAVTTIMDEPLSDLGFGSGFFFPADGVAKGIRQTVNVIAGEEYTLSWYLSKASAGSFTIDILDGTTVLETVTDITPVGAGYGGNFVTFTPPSNSVTVRFTAAGTVEATLTGNMLSLGNLPVPWTLASGELYNAVVRADERGLVVMRLDDNGDVEGYTNMSPEEFAGYYDENRDGNFERVFWLNQDETVTKKLRALEEITMGTLKIIRIESSQNRGWAIAPIVPEE